MIVFKCISCGSRLRVSDDKAGKRGKCPKCNMMVRVPRSQQEADATEAHRQEVRARKMNEHRKLGEYRQSDAGDGDIFTDVVGEVLSNSPAWRSPVSRQEVPQPSPEASSQEPPPADEAEHDAADAPPPGDPDTAGTPPSDDPDEQPEAPDPEVLRRSAEAPSAPPMSWPVESAPSGATESSQPGSDLDALAQAALAVRTNDPAPDEAPAGRAEAAQSQEEPPAEDVPQGAGVVRLGTAAVKGSHGLLALLLLLVVAAAVVGVVGWRNREHTWRFRDAITRCLPSVKFSSDGAGGKALPGCLTGKILLCNESGGPCSLRARPNPRLVARSADEVGTVIFIRRNDDVPEAGTFRVMGKPPVRPPVGYEMCAVDVASGRRVCAETVVAADDKQAVEALYRLIDRCLRRRPPG